TGTGYRAGVKLLASVLPMFMLAMPVAAMAGEREPYSPEATAAFGERDYALSARILRAQLEQCEAAKPQDDRCLDLLLALGKIENWAGEYAAGADHAARAAALAERVLGSGHPDVALARIHLA